MFAYFLLQNEQCLKSRKLSLSSCCCHAYDSVKCQETIRIYGTLGVLILPHNNTGKRCLWLSISNKRLLVELPPIPPRTHDMIMRLRTLRRFITTKEYMKRHAGRSTSAACLFNLGCKTSLVHDSRHQHRLALILGECVFSHQGCSANGSITKPSSQIVNSVFKSAASFPSFRIIENIQLQWLIDRNQIDTTNGQRTNRLMPQIPLSE